MRLNRRMFCTIVLALSIPAAALVGCSESDDPDPFERPDEARTLVGDAELQRFIDNGLPVYGGDEPPSIAGTYFFGRLRDVIYNESEYLEVEDGGVWCDGTITFATTDNPAQYDTSATSSNCDSESEGIANFISGDGDCFTLYSETDSRRDDCHSTQLSILSACITASGDLEDPIEAMIFRTQEGADCQSLRDEGVFTDVGELLITSQTDRIAEKIN